MDDQVARSQAQLRGQRGDQLLGADHRQHALDTELGHAVPAGQPVDRCLPGLDPPDRGGVARRVGRRLEGTADDVRRRVDGGPDRQVDDPVGMGACLLGVRRELVPGKVGQAMRHGNRDFETALARLLNHRCGHSSCSWGGSAATSSWSWSISPSLAAPPGEPRSSKKWTLAS